MRNYKVEDEKMRGGDRLVITKQLKLSKRAYTKLLKFCRDHCTEASPFIRVTVFEFIDRIEAEEKKSKKKK